jgi:hypothetical protein
MPWGNDNDFVDTGSGEYVVGQVTAMFGSLFVGPGRLAYAAVNKVSSIRYLRLGAQQTTFATRLSVAKEAYNSRIDWKKIFNFGLPGKLKYSWNDILHEYLFNWEDIIRASGRTSKLWNAGGAGLTAAGIKEGLERYLGIDSMFVEIFDAYEPANKMKIMQ